MMSQCRFFATSSSTTLRAIGGSIEDYESICSQRKMLTPLNVPPELNINTLPPGLQDLFDEDRISLHVAFLANVSLDNTYVDLRDRKSMVDTVLSLDLIEHVEFTIANGGNSIEDKILLMIIHSELYGLLNGERCSPLHLEIVRHWAGKCLEWMPLVQPDDTALVNIFLFGCFKVSGTMTAESTRMKSTGPTDIRMRVMVKARAKFLQMRSWQAIHLALNLFNPRPEYLYDCRQVWNMLLVLEDTEQP